jgi:hypothetical protein
MKIQKKYQGAIPLNRIANEHNESEINTYSTNYVNSQLTTLHSDVDELQAEVQTINTKLPKAVACNFNEWQTSQVIEGAGAGAVLEGMDTYITTNGGNILVSLYLMITHTGGTCWLNLYIDGVEVMRYAISHTGGRIAYTNVFPVPAGQHRVYAAIHNNNVAKVTLDGYTSRAFTVAEI